MVTRITQTNLKTIQTHQPTAVGRGPYRGRLKGGHWTGTGTVRRVEQAMVWRTLLR